MATSALRSLEQLDPGWVTGCRCGNSVSFVPTFKSEYGANCRVPPQPLQRPDDGSLAPATDSADPVTWLCDGGFAPDTELLTDDGLTTVADCLPGDCVLALDTTTNRAVTKPIVAVESIEPSPTVVSGDARRVGFRVRPSHRMCLYTAGGDHPRTIRAGTLDAYSVYKFVNSWTTPARRRLDRVDVTRLCEDYEVCVTHDGAGQTFRAALPEGCDPSWRNDWTDYHFDAATFEANREAIEALADEITVRTGRNARRRPRLFDGDDFLRFLGWYATEGSVTERETSDTIEIKLAQGPGADHDAIAALCERMGFAPAVTDEGISFSSRLFGRLFARLCGDESRTKQLPPVVHGLPTRQQRLLLDILLRGDGNDNGIFYTTSDRLAVDVLWLCAAVGVSPRYMYCETRGWRVSVQGTNDGLNSTTQVETVSPTAEPYYRLAVAEFPTVLAGRNGRFQWIGTSGVA